MKISIDPKTMESLILVAVGLAFIVALFWYASTLPLPMLLLVN